jgi:glycosyltransferase involved in cell wall biosynthesis
MLTGPERPKPRTAAVMPCYNIAAQAAQTAARALPHADAVIAVDDGSSDGTAQRLEELKAGPDGGKLDVLRLPANGGKGAALEAGFAKALAARPPFDLIVAIDGDLQHHPEDIPRFMEAWRNGADFVCGRRAFRMDAPLRSRIGNNFINWLAGRLFPNAVSDTQSGFRGFGRGLLAELRAGGAMSGARYENELRTLIAVMKRNDRVIELDIPAIYLDRNRTSHFRPVADSARIVLELLAGAFRRGKT